MKYLGIHKLIWAVLVLIYTLLDGLIFVVMNFVYLVWFLSIPEFKGLWERFHNRDAYENYWDGKGYCDKNILESFKRRYYMFKRNN